MNKDILVWQRSSILNTKLKIMYYFYKWYLQNSFSFTCIARFKVTYSCYTFNKHEKQDVISTSFGSFLLLLYPNAFPVSSTRCLKNDRKASRGHARRSDLTFIVLAICFNMKLMLCEPTHVMFHSPVYDQLIVYDQGKRKTLGLRDALSLLWIRSHNIYFD